MDLFDTAKRAAYAQHHPVDVLADGRCREPAVNGHNVRGDNSNVEAKQSNERNPTASKQTLSTCY